MRTLEEITSTFRASEPTYDVKVEDGGQEVVFSIKDRYQPEFVDGDVLAGVCASLHRETLDIKGGRYVSSVDKNRVFAAIYHDIVGFMLRTHPNNKPKQTKLYKWLASRDPLYNNPDSPAIMALFEYIHHNNIETSRDNSNPHAKNVLAVLELLREKYEHDEKKAN